MIITELQLTKLKGVYNTLYELAENNRIEDYQSEIYYFLGVGLESIINEIEQIHREQQ